jgi:hypothetical protein
MNIEKNTFYDVRKIPGDKLGLRTISDVTVAEGGDVELTFSDTAKKELPAPAPLPVKDIVSAAIVGDDLVVNFNNGTSQNIGRVNPTFTKEPPAFTGTGLLADDTTGAFKKLAGVGPFLNITETVNEFKLTIDLSEAVVPPPPPAGTFVYDQVLSTTWKSTTPFSDTAVGAMYYLPGTNTAAWNSYDVSGLNEPSPYPVTFNADKSFVLPAGHYYVEFYTQYTVDGVAELQLFDVTNNAVVLNGLGVESVSTGDYSVHQGTALRGEFVLTAPTTLLFRGKAGKYIYLGYTINREGIDHHIVCSMMMWKISDTALNLNRNTPQLDNSWKQLTAVYNPASAISTVAGTFSVTYTCGTINLYVNTVKVPNGGNYIIPDTARKFVFLSDDGLIKTELGSPIDISSGTRPFGKHSTLASNGRVYVPAYNAAQHVQIIPMPIGGWVRPAVTGGYDYFPRPIAIHDPHITVTAPVPVTGHATALSLFKNSKATGQSNEYYSVATATPEIKVELRLPITLKALRLSRGTYGLITEANLYSVEGGTRTLLAPLVLSGNDMVAEGLTGAAAKEYVVVIVTAAGSAGAVQFGCNGIQLIVAEEIDTAKYEGVVELIPGAPHSTVTAKYEIAQGSPLTDEIMFIPVSNFDTRGGFEFYDPVANRWRKDTFGLTINAAYIFSCAICSPLNDNIFIFTRTPEADFYIYNPVKKVIKTLPFMATGVDCVVNGLDGKIYGAIGNSNQLTVVEPLKQHVWSVGTDTAYAPTAEITQMLFGNDGKLRIFPYNGPVYTIDFTTMTCTAEGTTIWWYVNVRMLNGEYFAFIARRLTGSVATISNYYYKRFTGSFTPDRKLQLGHYVN